MNREQMILHNLPLVRFVASRLPDMPLEPEDALAAGVEGLIQAVDRFEPERGSQFASYAVPRIRGAILDASRRADPLARSVRERVRRLSEAEHQAESWSAGDRPSWDQLVALTALAPERADAVRHLKGAAFVSLEHAHERGAPGELATADPLDPDADPPADVERAEEVQALHEAVARLEPRQRELIRLRYVRGWPFYRIGKHLNLSESRACQIHQRTLRLLRIDLGRAA